jgi:hypothetical protein
VQSSGFAEFLEAAREAIAPLTQALLEEPGLLERALHTLQHLGRQDVDAQSPTRSQAVQALTNAEQRNLLAGKIAHEIASHPDTAKVPELVRAFVCGPWAQVVAQARMSGGKGSAAADRYHALISALLWSTHPDLAHQNTAKLTKLMPLLLGTLRQGLDTIQYPAAQTSAFLEVLMGLHQAAFRASSTLIHIEAGAARVPPSKFSGLVLPPPLQNDNPWVAPSEARDSNFLSLTDDPPTTTNAATILSPMPSPVGSDAGAEDLPLGSWVELHAYGEWARTQLTWASPHGTLFLFTSVNGSTQSMTQHTYDRLLAMGQLRVISTRSFVDGALDAVAYQALKNSVRSGL